MLNKKLERLIIIIVILLLGWYVVSIILNKNVKRDPNTIFMWIAPNQTQSKFWSEVVKEWNDSGLGLQVEYRNIPDSSSSEEAILTSIVSNTNPDICTNIFSGFGAQLAALDAIVPLSEFEGYDELIAKREMKDIMDSWKFQDKNFIFPIYCNPILNWWRMDKLRENGFDELPITYSDLYKIAEKVTIPYKQYAIKVFSGRTWSSRWNDYIAYYYAASDGKPYIVDDKAALDNEYSKDVLDFFAKCTDNGWTLRTDSNDAFYTGKVFGEVHGAWDVAIVEQLYPEIKKDIGVGPILVPDNHEGPIYTFADSKGIVLFDSCQRKDEAWKFIKWVFSQDKFSRLWLEYTNMPPARGDLLTNPIFKEYYDSNQIGATYAEYVNRAVPSALITNTIDVQQAMTNYAIEPIQYKTESVGEIIQNLTKKINKLMEKNPLK